MRGFAHGAPHPMPTVPAGLGDDDLPRGGAFDPWIRCHVVRRTALLSVSSTTSPRSEPSLRCSSRTAASPEDESHAASTGHLLDLGPGGSALSSNGDSRGAGYDPPAGTRRGGGHPDRHSRQHGRKPTDSRASPSPRRSPARVGVALRGEELGVSRRRSGVGVPGSVGEEAVRSREEDERCVDVSGREGSEVRIMMEPE